jgi:hypothetical protein
MSENDNDNTKVLEITGTHNRYMVKQANRNLSTPKKRVFMDKNNLSVKELTFEEQILCLHKLLELLELNDNNTDYDLKKERILYLMKQELERKINNYKQQDLQKNMYIATKFIDLPLIINKLMDCKMVCYYCNENVFIFYDNVRETCQWTVDRIDNDIGHNKDNFIIACLSCNIKRKRRTVDKFLFTTNLNIIKMTL